MEGSVVTNNLFLALSHLDALVEAGLVSDATTAAIRLVMRTIRNEVDPAILPGLYLYTEDQKRIRITDVICGHCDHENAASDMVVLP